MPPYIDPWLRMVVIMFSLMEELYPANGLARPEWNVDVDMDVGMDVMDVDCGAC